MMKQWPLLVGLLLLGVPDRQALSGDPTVKEAWRWNIDERLVLRNDPAAAAQRLRQYRDQGSSSRKVSVASQMPDEFDFISGREHPELMLPWEIFDCMMATAYADDQNARAVFREVRNSHLVAIGLPPDFWSKLEAVSYPYLSDSRQLRDLHKGRVMDAAVQNRIRIESVALENLKCRDRAEAIAASRQAFGEKFDRFLYESVAPSMFIAVGSQGPIAAARLREIERGCR
jgi:hypothetical protein